MSVLATLLCLSTAVAPPPAADVPPIFGTRDHAQASALAREQGRLLLVDFTASWCAPCHKLDATTWLDPGVVAWVEQHAIAVQVDVDASPQVSGSYGVRAMPTIIVVRDGTEIDRVTGYRDAAVLLTWLEASLAGTSELDRLRAAAVDTQARYDLAGELVLRGEDAEASGHVLWLWDHMVEEQPSLAAVRTSFFVQPMSELAARHEPTRLAFAERFVRAREALEQGDHSDETWTDWRVLAAVLGRKTEALTWLAGQCDEQGRLATASVRVVDALMDVCLSEGQLVQAARLSADLGEAAQRWVSHQQAAAGERARAQEAVAELYPEVAASLAERTARKQREQALVYVRLALALEDDAQLARVEPVLLAADDSTSLRTELLRLVLDHNAARRRHLALALELQRRAETGADALSAEDLMERLAAALETAHDDDGGRDG